MAAPDTLNVHERALLELHAEGLGDREISARLQKSLREISAIRRDTVAKLEARISSAHPFQICETLLSRSLDPKVSLKRD
jgi:DNA-binding NarL/FixJ family response regulator